jgi:hypothetical protein
MLGADTLTIVLRRLGLLHFLALGNSRHFVGPQLRTRGNGEAGLGSLFPTQESSSNIVK